jgi:hypothetical protein
MPRQSLIAFDFWGAGNMGDDLMMAGFLEGLDHCGVRPKGLLWSLSAFDIASQRKRFPGIEWFSSKDRASLDRLLASTELLLGVGDTPFQITCGDWFLRHLEHVFRNKRAGTEAIFINVGAEEEVLPRAGEFAAILRQLSRCSTRDAFSHSVLHRLDAERSTLLLPGGDLAHISLERLSGTIAVERKFPLGVVLGIDTLSGNDLDAIRGYLGTAHAPVAFITGDLRDGPGFESHLFKTWTGRWFSRLRRQLTLRHRDYRSCSLEELVLPLAECETILSSRLHGILAAAWLGCRVAAIGRSSKVVAFAEQLGVPCAKPPLTEDALKDLVPEAVVVPRRLLEAARDEAYQGLTACKFW